MKYPKPTDRYDCSVLCQNFEEIEGRLKDLESGSDLPEITASDEGKVLMVKNGKYVLGEVKATETLEDIEGVEF